MTTAPDDFVRDKTRHIVGRAALKQASTTVQGWRAEEAEKARLAKQLTLGLLIIIVLSLATFFLS